MKSRLLPVLLGIFLIGTFACQPAAKEAAEAEYGNPPAEGFNLEGSDAQAIAIADEVMEASGGREAWDNTRHINWKFFGRRGLTWDKWTGNVRIELDTITWLVNINYETGNVYFNGQALEAEADSIQFWVNRGKSIWINDSYWLVMPFKLKDSGVTLKYMGEEASEDGNMADKLQLTFEGVGRTPQNKYYVWVDKTSRLVSQWAYYPTVDTEEAQFVNPWINYQKMGGIMLSDDRGRFKHTDVMVFDDLPESVYTSPEKPELKATEE